MEMVRSEGFRAGRARGALDIAKMNGITTRLHRTDRPYRWHVNDAEAVSAVLDGRVEMHCHEGGAEHRVMFNAGDVFFADLGCEPVARPQDAARILVIEPEGSV